MRIRVYRAEISSARRAGKRAIKARNGYIIHNGKRFDLFRVIADVVEISRCNGAQGSDNNIYHFGNEICSRKYIAQMYALTTETTRRISRDV